VSYIQGYDHQTLREIVDPRACRERLEEIDGQRSLPALLERVWLLKVTDQLDEAREVAEVAVRTARMAGTRRDLLRARILHATVQQFRGQLAAADQELTLCARADVKATLFLRREAGASEEELTSTLLAIDLLDRMRAGAAASIAG
jgi:hypothetical protein